MTTSSSGKPRDFEQIVKVVLATFAVFTGFVFSSYLKDDLVLIEFDGWFGWVVWFDQWRFWGFFALMALLLRYIMGSAVHLTFMYVQGKGADGKPTESRSQSVILLFKDLMFLVAFGVIAMSIANAAKPDPASTDLLKVVSFMHRAALFVAAGFIWSVIDAVLRWGWSWCRTQEHPGYFWLIWCALDAAQFGVTLLILGQLTDPLGGMKILAGAYVVFLLLDVAAIVRAVQAHP